MKTFARKFLSVTLAAMMLLSMLPTVAFAASETEDFLRILKRHSLSGGVALTKELLMLKRH